MQRPPDKGEEMHKPFTRAAARQHLADAGIAPRAPWQGLAREQEAARNAVVHGESLPDLLGYLPVHVPAELAQITSYLDPPPEIRFAHAHPGAHDEPPAGDAEDAVYTGHLDGCTCRECVATDSWQGWA